MRIASTPASLHALLHALLFALLLATGPAQAASSFNFANAPGPHPVGFKVVRQYDTTRTYRDDADLAGGEAAAGERARPIQTLIWYPARAAGKAMTYGDYLALTGSDDDFTRTDARARAVADVFVRNNYAWRSGLARAVEEAASPMRAQRDAAPDDGKYPVVIYAPSISAPAAENADLCEYLASHGYLVIASPSVGPRGRTMPADLDGARTQAADIAFLVGYARTLPQADPREEAVMGFSWGGIANVFAAAVDGRIKALVNLDGSVRYYPDLVAASKTVTPLTVHVPMLFVAQRPASLEAIAKRGKPAASFLNEMKYGDLYTLTMMPMEHFAFSSTTCALRRTGTSTSTRVRT